MPFFVIIFAILLGGEITGEALYNYEANKPLDKEYKMPDSNEMVQNNL